MAWQRGFSRNKEHPATKADFEATAQRQRRESLRCQTCRAHSRADTMSRRQTASKTAAISNQRQCKCHASKRRAMPNQLNGGRKSDALVESACSHRCVRLIFLRIQGQRLPSVHHGCSGWMRREPKPGSDEAALFEVWTASQRRGRIFFKRLAWA